MPLVGVSGMTLYMRTQILAFPSQVQNVPVSRMVFCSTTRSMPATDSSAFMIPSTSHPRDTFAMSLSKVSQNVHAEVDRVSDVATSPGCMASIVVAYLFRSSSAAMCYAGLTITIKHESEARRLL